ncbi:unnamed protein product [Gulo gulo]|uniref:Uncharacterized protein n=1 Tax=Gulo gulo TaxID=48420 RepID=A0A9X9PU80_GULGU|nr:unnamed protein product [Gulo gulo]
MIPGAHPVLMPSFCGFYYSSQFLELVLGNQKKPASLWWLIWTQAVVKLLTEFKGRKTQFDNAV